MHPFFLLLLHVLLIAATDHSIAIGKEMIVDNRNQPGLIKLIQDFKEAVPFSGRKFADKVIDFLRRCIRTKVYTAVSGKVLIGLGSLSGPSSRAEFLFHVR